MHLSVHRSENTRFENFSKQLTEIPRALPTYVPEGRAAASLEGRTTLQALTPSLDMRGAASVVGSEILGGWRSVRRAGGGRGWGLKGEKPGGSQGGTRGVMSSGAVGGKGGRSEGSQATCTRQQPPTSEELIINLLSPSQTPL